jgi:hypothetical protein
MYQKIQLQDPPKFTQIRIFGLKIYHLATLVPDGGKERQTHYHCTFFGGKKSFEKVSF